MNTISAERLQHAVTQIAPAVQIQLSRIGNTQAGEPRLWRELACCVLSSQVPYDMAVAAAVLLDSEGLLENSIRYPRMVIEGRILHRLLIPLKVDGKSRRYRFPKSKANQLARTLEIVCQRYGSLAGLLDNHRDPLCARAWLVQHLPGIGPKQASMFLRNVGITYDVAVIDRHVLRYMLQTGLCGSDSKQPTSLQGYERHEEHLRNHAGNLGYPVGILDWAIWIVMRAAAALESA